MIVTLGYQRVPLPRLREIAEALDALVVDVRAKPASRIPGYHRSTLERELGAHYEWRGRELGGLPPGVDEGGPTPEGLAWLAEQDAAGRVLLLLCMEEAPGDCHRHLMICCDWDTGAVRFPEALHLYRDEVIRAADLQAALEAERDEYPCVDLDEWLAEQRAARSAA